MKENTPPQKAWFPEIPLPQTVIHYCEQYGIQHIVISAGSRNAPLTNGFVEALISRPTVSLTKGQLHFLVWAWHNNSNQR